MRKLGYAAAALLTAVGAVLVPASGSSHASQPAAKSGVVVIANGWSPPDVGAAVTLAGRLDAVVLYASTDELGTPTVSALRRLRPARAVLMGSTAALSENVTAQVRTVAPGAEIRRISGSDRFDTAALAARARPTMPRGRPVVIANGWSSPDAGVAASLADALGGSVLFAGEHSLGPSTMDTLLWLDPSQLIIVGSSAVLGSSIETALHTAVPGVPVLRLSGVDRADTAALGAQLARGAARGPVVIANGWSPPDVGVAASLAAAVNGTVLFSNHTELGRFTSTYLRNLATSEVLLVGGHRVLPSSIEAEVSSLLPSATVRRTYGPDRMETASNAAFYAISKTIPRTGGGNGDGELIYVSMGDSFSSGVGTNKTPPSRETNPCYRTQHAFGNRLFLEMLDWVPHPSQPSFPPTFRFTACGGARSRHVFEKNQAAEQWPTEELSQEEFRHWSPQYPQIEYLDDSVDLVTVTVGGNDLGFTSIVKYCAIVANCHEKFRATTSNGVDPNKTNIEGLYRRLFETYRAIIDRAPNATVYVIGYPTLFSDWSELAKETCFLYRFLETDEVPYLQELNRLLNQTIRAASEDAGVYFVDIANSASGKQYRGACSHPGISGGFINDPDVIGALPISDGNTNFLHPNESAHQAYATEILQDWFPGWLQSESLHAYLGHNRVSFRSALVSNPAPLFRRGSQPSQGLTFEIGFIEERRVGPDHATIPSAPEWVADIGTFGTAACDVAAALLCRVGVRSRPSTAGGEWSEYIY